MQLAFERRADAVNREILDTALLEVGAATLSPTCDSIMFEEAANLAFGGCDGAVVIDGTRERAVQ